MPDEPTTPLEIAQAEMLIIAKRIQEELQREVAVLKSNLLAAQNKRTKDIANLRAEISNEIEGAIGERNCTCHQHPPCSDCSTFGALRELIVHLRSV